MKARDGATDQVKITRFIFWRPDQAEAVHVRPFEASIYHPR
jgi:hypothetical protein